jgi:hypothetical protein
MTRIQQMASSSALIPQIDPTTTSSTASTPIPQLNPDRRSRAREIATATQRGIDNRLRLYRERDQAAQESIQGANENDRQTTTPSQRNAENNGANIGDVFGLSGPASRDMALLSRQEREGKADGASEISEAV